jgi:hypothetical protein
LRTLLRRSDRPPTDCRDVKGSASTEKQEYPEAFAFFAKPNPTKGMPGPYQAGARPLWVPVGAQVSKVKALSVLLDAAEQRRLSPTELVRLRELLTRRGRGRPRRTPLREFQIEFERAVSYGAARAKGTTYDQAVASAASSAATSDRRIKASFQWMKSKLGVQRTEIEKFFRRADQIAERMPKKGFAGFDLKELALLSCTDAIVRTFNATFSDERRVELLVDGTFQRLFLEALDRTFAALRQFAQQDADQGVASAAASQEQFALLVDAIASNVATMLFKRGCTNSE